MPNVKIFKLLSVNCSTVEPCQKSRQINEQTMQNKSCINKNSKSNVTINGKYKHRINYFNVVDKEMDMKASAKLMESLHRNLMMFFSGIGYFKVQVKDSMILYKVSLKHVAYAVQEPFKKELE